MIFIITLEGIHDQFLIYLPYRNLFDDKVPISGSGQVNGNGTGSAKIRNRSKIDYVGRTANDSGYLKKERSPAYEWYRAARKNVCAERGFTLRIRVLQGPLSDPVIYVWRVNKTVQLSCI